MPASTDSISKPNDPIRIRPKRRTRPRRIGPLWLPFWWLARRTRRVRPLLWTVAYGTAGSSLAVMVGARLLLGIADVHLPAFLMEAMQPTLITGLVAILVLRLMGMAETPEEGPRADVRWLLPKHLR